MFLNKLKSLAFFFKKKRIVAQYKLFFGDEWLEASVDSIAPYVYKILFVISDVAWGDDPKNPKIKGDDFNAIIEALNKKYPGKLHVHYGTWNEQLKHVQAGLEYIKEIIPEASHCLYIDGDEIYSEKLINKINSLLRNYRTYQAAIRISYYTYFKTIYYRIEPIKYPNHLVLFPVTNWIQYVDARNVNAKIIELPELKYEHPAYVRFDDERMRIKIEAHRETEAIIGDWYKDVWLNWRPEIRNFHPTQPELWEGVIQVSKNELPSAMVEVYEKFDMMKK